MKEIRETSRRSSPFSKPQSIAFDRGALWVGSIATDRIYRLDPATLGVLSEAEAPGKPWGMTVVRTNGGSELRVICGHGDDDDRFVHRFEADRGRFESNPLFECPQSTGSQLSFDGERLFVSQWYDQRVLRVDDEGRVLETIQVPHQICGQTFVEGSLYLLTTDDESTNDYWLTRIRLEDPQRRAEDLARVPFHARGLAFDGSSFWTNHREADKIVTFVLS
ncbi:MAG: hypothetical protein JO359_05520 [Candidatus Eremiobacteraeota bacterium]|nr:hypothetical protein [Candidatus Eremiobacteraeota bacterium]